MTGLETLLLQQGIQHIGVPMAQWGAGKIGEWWHGPQQETPEQQAQQAMLQQMQRQNQFQRVDFDPIAQHVQRQFQQQALPGLKEQFVASGGARTGAFSRAVAGAEGDLASRLAALRAQHDVGQQQAQMQNYGLDLQRLGGLGSYLTGQQNLGMQAQQLGQQQRQSALDALQGLGRFGQQSSAQDTQRAQARANLAGNVGNVGTGGRAFDQTSTPAGSGALPAIIQALGSSAKYWLPLLV